MLNRTAIIKQPDKISSFNDVYKLQKEYQEALISDNSNPDSVSYTHLTLPTMLWV